jgi:hypothetical protein
MLIIQHIWTKWTKATRGAHTPVQRPRLAEAYELPAIEPGGGPVRHEIRALEREGFEIVESAGGIDRDGWKRQQPWRETPLDWRDRGDLVEIVLRAPSDRRQQTKWPAYLPVPLFAMRLGETARIDWNGRFISSMSGYNRATYYEQHTYWLAVSEAPHARLFLDAEPRKTVDLRTEIY